MGVSVETPSWSLSPSWTCHELQVCDRSGLSAVSADVVNLRVLRFQRHPQMAGTTQDSPVGEARPLAWGLPEETLQDKPR